MLNKLAPQKVNFKQKLHLVFFRGEGAGERLIFTKVMSYILFFMFLQLDSSAGFHYRYFKDIKEI